MKLREGKGPSSLLRCYSIQEHVVLITLLDTLRVC